MNRFLSRGFQISDDDRITKVIAGGTDWEIYNTVLGCFVLAADPALFRKWVQDYRLPEHLFSEKTDPDCRFFGSSGDYLIASVSQGPYPHSESQIQAFSVSFKMALEQFPEADFSEAIYIEEYSLLLPTTFDRNGSDNRMIYGKWLTGGIGIPIDAMDQVSRIMSWIPRERLAFSAGLAGFDVPKGSVAGETGLKLSDAAQENPDELYPHRSRIPEEKFSLPGRTELEAFFNEHIVDIVRNREAYARMGIPFPGATMLYGAPGCGKTFAVDRLAEYLGWPMFTIDSGTIGSPFIHDTSKKIAGIFRAAIDAAPSIIIIDEMEAFLSDRSASGSAGAHHIEEVAEFLRKIPEATEKGVLVFAMTNMIDAIDPAIMRRGRFDHIVEVKMAGKDEVEQLLKVRFAELPVDNSVNPADLAEKLAGRPLSDAAFVLREAGKTAVRRGMQTMDQSCFDEALDRLPKKKEHSGFGFLDL